jgi:hypothetical protein
MCVFVDDDDVVVDDVVDVVVVVVVDILPSAVVRERIITCDVFFSLFILSYLVFVLFLFIYFMPRAVARTPKSKRVVTPFVQFFKTNICFIFMPHAHRRARGSNPLFFQFVFPIQYD